MGTIEIWALLTVFGAVCAFSVTVIGFALTAVATLFLLGLFNVVIGGNVTLGVLGGGLVALQIGYFAGIVASAVVGSLGQAPRKDPTGLKGDLHVKHD